MTPYSQLPKSLEDLIKSPLESGEETHGYVYLYEVDGNEGWVKLGYTTRTIEDRLNEWTSDCNRKTKRLYPPTGSAIKVRNAKRVEKLCHTELHDFRYNIDCTACLMEHNEWFKISSKKAIAVIERSAKKTLQIEQKETRMNEGSTEST
jgi:hypothetical protein